MRGRSDTLIIWDSAVLCMSVFYTLLFFQDYRKKDCDQDCEKDFVIMKTLFGRTGVRIDEGGLPFSLFHFYFVFLLKIILESSL